MTLLLFAASYLFFSLCLDGHLHYREWFQMFQFTPEYFGRLASAPGGIAAWLSRFLTQFSTTGWVGALTYALVLTGIQLLTAALDKSKSLLGYALSFIPSCSLWVALCYADFTFVPAVSILVILACALAAKALPEGNIRTVAVIALSPALWWVCGPFAFIFPAAFVRDEKWWTPTAGLLLIACCPLVFNGICPYDLATQFVGIFYSGLPWTVPGLLWLCAALTAAVLVALSFKLPDKLTAAIPAYLVCAALTCLGANKMADFQLEDLLDYSQLAYEGKWKDIIKKYESSAVSAKDVHLITTEDGSKWDMSPTYCLKYSCAALAYAKQGRLVENLFTHFCPGMDGLVPPYEKTSHLNNVFSSDVYFHLAMTSQSQEQMFESMETIMDKQKGSRAYRRLAETNSINGNIAASQKYLDALARCPSHRAFSESFDHNSPRMEKYRRLRYNGQMYSHDPGMIESALLDLVTQCPDNVMAMQYLVASVLLKKDLQYLDQVINEAYAKQGASEAPDAVQQAMLIWLVSRDNFAGQAPEFISKENIRLGVEFNDEFEQLAALPESKVPAAITALRKKYGKTYYFFYYLQ